MVKDEETVSREHAYFSLLDHATGSEAGMHGMETPDREARIKFGGERLDRRSPTSYYSAVCGRSNRFQSAGGHIK